jgi:hypothetical protein
MLPLLLALWLTPTPLQTPANQQARQVVDQAIAALGGERYLQARYRSGEGYIYSFNSSGELNGGGTRFWAWYRFPADERIELTKDRNVIYIYAGGQGWEITYKGVAPVLRRALSEYQNAAAHSLDVILKTWASDPNTLILDQGQNNFDQAPVESILFTTQSGESATVDFSLRTHLPLRVRWPRVDTDTGGHYEQSVVYGNWSDIGGIEAAFSQDEFQGPQKLEQRNYTKLSFAAFPDSLFTPKPLK